MAGGLLTRSQGAVTGFVLAGPRLLARGTAPAVGAAAGAAAGTARAGAPWLSLVDEEGNKLKPPQETEASKNAPEGTPK
ncbi:hypothetical protein AB0B06_00005, partial [Streptomyces sp. NPDC044989]|uniref:hypothetical protein n=1 Tax=Streptomyces sp. NPDC044989 TaxID=3154336 RepID=UPI0033F29F09